MFSAFQSFGRLGAAGTVGEPTPQIRLPGSRQVAENAAEDTVVGTPSVVNGVAAGPITISAQSHANWFKMASGVLKVGSVSPNYETDDEPTVTLTDGVLTRTFKITVTNVPEVTLGDLALDDGDVEQSAAATINITGATSTSTIAVLTGSLPAGMTLNSGARTITGTPTTLGTYNFTLRETHSDAADHDTALSIVVSAAGDSGLPTPTAVWTSDEYALDPTINMTEAVEGDVAAIEISTSSDFSSLYGSATNTIDAGEAASGSLTFDTPTLLTATTYYARVRYQRGSEWSDWSNTVSKTMAASDVPDAFGAGDWAINAPEPFESADWSVG